MPLQKVILIGGGGHCKSVIDIIESGNTYEIEGILDVAENVGKQILGYTISGTDHDIETLAASGCSFIITVGQIRSSALREKIYTRLQACKASIATIIAPTAAVSKHAEIGAGTVILHHATVNAGAVIGQNNIINTGSNIEHDVYTGNHCHIATHAVLNGDCRIGTGVFIGSNAVLAQGILVCDKAIVGAGTVVYKDIAEQGTYVGNPAKKLP